MDRSERAEEVYERLFGPRDPAVAEDDPEFMAILRGLIFGDVFSIGDLDDPQRELITVIVLTVNQTLPQLRAHVAAALNVGVTPLEVREALYTCAMFIGFPRTSTRSPRPTRCSGPAASRCHCRMPGPLARTRALSGAGSTRRPCTGRTWPPAWPTCRTAWAPSWRGC